MRNNNAVTRLLLASYHVGGPHDAPDTVMVVSWHILSSSNLTFPPFNVVLGVPGDPSIYTPDALNATTNRLRWSWVSPAEGDINSFRGHH